MTEIGLLKRGKLYLTTDAGSMELSSIRDLKATINKEGKHGASMEVTADDIEFLSPKAEQVDQQTGYKKVEPDDLPY